MKLKTEIMENLPASADDDEEEDCDTTVLTACGVVNISGVTLSPSSGVGMAKDTPVSVIKWSRYRETHRAF